MAEWRVGRQLLRTLYRDEVCVGMVDSPEIAREIVHRMNLIIPIVVPDGLESGRERSPDLCPTCGDPVRPGRYDSLGYHPVPGQAALCPGRRRTDTADR